MGEGWGIFSKLFIETLFKKQEESFHSVLKLKQNMGSKEKKRDKARLE
jgi:hypothetical protein